VDFKERSFRRRGLKRHPEAAKAPPYLMSGGKILAERSQLVEGGVGRILLLSSVETRLQRGKGGICEREGCPEGWEEELEAGVGAGDKCWYCKWIGFRGGVWRPQFQGKSDVGNIG